MMRPTFSLPEKISKFLADKYCFSQTTKVRLPSLQERTLTESNSMGTASPPCPLCTTLAGSDLFHKDRNRWYYRCRNCNLIHVPPSQYLSRQAEYAEYNKHQNSEDDDGYRVFLSRLFTPLNERLSPESFGLDFGCGPGPTLSALFEEAGHRMNLYDPFFAVEKEALNNFYDFITASEVVEHLHHPAKELEHLWSILKPGGWLGIMTKLALDKSAFAKWHYKNDLTHVCFFSSATMRWLAEKWQAKQLQIGKDVTLFQKPSC